MWKHKKCGGDVIQVNNEGEWCSDCNQRELSDGDVYLEHYIINPDGKNVMSDLGGSQHA